MSINYKVEGIDISAIRDRAMFNTFAGNVSYVIKDIGDELKVTSAPTSFIVTLGTGEAVICGGSTLVSANENLTLTANQSGYLVLRVDLSQTGTNVCRFMNVSSLVQKNINNGVDLVYDLPLYQYTTNANGVATLTDKRKIQNNALNDLSNSKQNNLVAGRGIQLSNSNISNVFTNLTSPNLNDIKYNFQGYVTTATNMPSGVANSGELCVIANSANTLCYQLYSPNNSNNIYIRNFNSTWSGWETIAKGNTIFNTAPFYTGSANDLLDPGVYYSNNTITDLPEGTYGILLVYSNVNKARVVQEYHRAGTTNINEQYIYKRNYGTDGWGKWYKYSPTNELVSVLLADDNNIANNTNLNSLTTAGSYRCQNATVAGTLANTPINNGAFRLVVMQFGSSSLIQFAIGANFPNVYSRTTSNNGTSWNAWVSMGETYEATYTAQTEVYDDTSLASGASRRKELTLSRSGYEPIGVVGIQNLSTTGIIVVSSYIGGNKLVIDYKNISSSAISRIEITAYVLWRKV